MRDLLLEADAGWRVHDYIGRNVVSAVGAVLLLYGLPGVFARWREGWGWMGLAGIALFALVEILVVFFSLIAGAFFPWLAVKAPDLFKDPTGPPLYAAVTTTLFVAWIAGDILMAIPILRRRVGPRWAGFLLMASTVMLVVYVGAALSPPNALLALVGSLSPILAWPTAARLPARPGAARTSGSCRSPSWAERRRSAPHEVP